MPIQSDAWGAERPPVSAPPSPLRLPLATLARLGPQILIIDRPHEPDEPPEILRVRVAVDFLGIGQHGGHGDGANGHPHRTIPGQVREGPPEPPQTGIEIRRIEKDGRELLVVLDAGPADLLRPPTPSEGPAGEGP